jgi:hypothetical protein
MINWLVPKVAELSKKITELEEEKEAEKKQ